MKSLVEEIVEGSVGVESTLGQGSSRFAEFPVTDLDVENDEVDAFEYRALALVDSGETGVDTGSRRGRRNGGT